MHVGAELFEVIHVYRFNLPELLLLFFPSVSLKLAAYCSGVSFQELRGKSVLLLLRLVS